MKILEHVSHRNGVHGNSFNVLKFRDGNRNMIGVVFQEHGNIAVFDFDMLAKGNIAFGENSWRGDEYEHALRKMIQEEEEY